MAEVAVGAAIVVLRKAIDILGNLGVEYRNSLYSLKEDIDWIERQMRILQSSLTDADADADAHAHAMHDQTKLATNLMNDIRDLAYDVEDIMDTYMPALATRDWKGFLGWLKSFTNFIFCDSSVSDFVMVVQEIRRRVGEINGRNLSNVTQSVPGNKPNVGGFAWRKRERIFVGFEERLKDLTQKLHDEDVISIVAMGGTGKTTLAEELYRHATLKEEDDGSTPHLECKAKVVVSQTPNVKELLQDIARQVGLEVDPKKDRVEVKLPEYLTGKRYVILFDDIWHTQTWDNLCESIPRNSENGSKIIITSRTKSVGLHIGGENSLYELLPLNLDDSRKLFYEMVVESPDRDLSQELRDLGDQIVERCGGVPLSIVVTAGSLSKRERTVHAWKRVLDRMGQDKEVSKILALSYRDLDFELKPCFLYFGLFPEDYKFSIFQLINLWVAERFVNLNGKRAPEDIGEDYLEELIDRNLIQVCTRTLSGRIKSCRIHDLLHNLCISLAQKNNFFNTLNNVTSTSAVSVRRVTTYGDSIISFTYQTPKLRALLSFCTEYERHEMKHLKIVLGDLRFLRVLCVECRWLPSSLPNEIGNLSQLGYLRLWGSGPRKLPSAFSNLKNLLTLDVERCRELSFDDVIWKMKQLRHIILPRGRLFISHSFRDKFTRYKAIMHPFSRVETCLPNLQTLLHVDGVNMKFHWLRKFTGLRKLRINFSAASACDLVNLEIPKLNLSHCQNLCKLRLDGDMDVDMDAFFSPDKLPPNLIHLTLMRCKVTVDMDAFFSPDKLPPNLTHLTLMRCKVTEDNIEMLKKLRKLKVLKLVCNYYRGGQFVCSSAENFPHLEVLKLQNPINLKALLVEERGMPKLNKLQIHGCHQLREISDWLENKIKSIK